MVWNAFKSLLDRIETSMDRKGTCKPHNALGSTDYSLWSANWWSIEVHQ
jgi:hypothetical protein